MKDFYCPGSDGITRNGLPGSQGEGEVKIRKWSWRESPGERVVKMVLERGG